MPNTSETPAEIVTWARDLYMNAVDNKDAAGFAAVFTDDAWLRFGNAEPIVGRADIEAAIAQFFTVMVDLRHEFTAISFQGDTIFLEAVVTYTRQDGGVVVVPAMTVYHMSDVDGRRLAHRCQIYVDLAPLFAPSA
jgi:uncharacterized protein (TIGR02246 family)